MFLLMGEGTVKIVYDNCCGVDVQKMSVACLRSGKE